MATTGAAAIGRTASFSFSALSLPPPPARPIPRSGFGAPCFKATCDLVDDRLGSAVGKFVGYGPSSSIAGETVKACKVHGAKGKRTPHLACGDAQLTLLRSSPLECTGQIFFEMHGASRKVL